MKRIASCILIVVTVFLLLPTLFSGCIAKKYYTMEDFDSIIIGQSTMKDVFVIAPTKYAVVTSYGSLVEYPMQNGRWIQIRTYGPNGIVFAIEEVDEAVMDD
ncbi:MAG: hypothetical protein IJY82_06795 [Oscillospiraceae bacterium]|nr:hypothetical protein [Oscillospiraceae bacterium]